MDKLKKFTLKHPFVGHSAIRELVYREPRFADLMELGEWRTVSFTDEGKPFLVENHFVLKAYIERCLVEPRDFLTVEGELSFEDGAAVREWFVGFFNRGGRAIEASPTSPATSGSNAEQTPAP